MSAAENVSSFPAWLEPQPHSPLGRYVEAIRTTELDEPPEDGRNLARMVIGAAFDEAWRAKPGPDVLAVCATVAERLGSDLTAERICFLIAAELKAADGLANPATRELRRLAVRRLALALRSVDLTTH